VAVTVPVCASNAGPRHQSKSTTLTARRDMGRDYGSSMLPRVRPHYLRAKASRIS
jgi:hypothetical protein